MQDISQREHQVLDLLSNELSTKDIAAVLFISPHTVITHRKNLLEKLNVKNTAGAVRRGFELGYLKF